jgi:phage baseplate assembly protein W
MKMADNNPTAIRERRRVSHFVLQAAPHGNPRLERAPLEEHIRYTLRAALLTRQASRAFHPDLGSGLRDSLFRPLTSGTKSDIVALVKTAVQRSEPRVELEDILVSTDAVDRSRLQIQLKYRILETQKLDQVRVALAP